MPHIDDITLMAYADGELPDHEAAAVEVAIADDAALQEKLRTFIRVRDLLEGAVHDDPVHFIDLVNKESSEMTSTDTAPHIIPPKDDTKKRLLTSWRVLVPTGAVTVFAGFIAFNLYTDGMLIGGAGSPPVDEIVDNDGTSSGGEIVVTARKRETRVDDVRIAREEEVMIAEGFALQDSAKVRSLAAPASPVMMDRAVSGLATTNPQILPQPIPGTIDRERYEDFKINPVKIVGDEPVSTFSIDVDTASYAVTRRYLNDGIMPPNDAVRVEELINYFSYDYDLPDSKAEPFKTNAYLYETPWNAGTQLLHIGIKGYDVVPETRPDANLVLLLDVSGSMNSADKLPLLKKAMKMLVQEMGENDTVSIVVYAGAAGTVLEPTKGTETTTILNALERLNAGGSTAGGEGIRQAYNLAEQNFKEDAVNRVILATDGDFNVGINDPERLEDFVAQKRETGIDLTVLGFGTGNYNDALMQKIAQAGNGNAAYIDSVKEARKVLVDEMGGTLFTIAKDVKIQVEFNPAQVSEYRLIGYETRMLNREDFNNDKVDAGDIGSGHSVTAIYEIVPVGSEAGLTEPLRYGTQPQAIDENKEGETAFVRVRYKLPDEDTSKLIETPIKANSFLGIIDGTPPDVRFATAVAAFGQKLKGGTYLGNMSYESILTLAQGGKGADPYGYRAEFMQLVRLAQSADAMPALPTPGQGENR